MDLTSLVIKYFTFLFLLVLTVTSVKSQDLASAKILNIEGSVQITRPSPTDKTMNRIKIRPNDVVFVGDVIKTNIGGRLVLGLADGSQAIISENTTVEIKDAKNSPRTIFNILRGKTRIKIEKLGGKPNPYRVTTPTTVIAVRGTIFDVFVKGDKTEVFVVEGEVSVTNLFVPDREVILTPGQFTRVEKEQPPRPPSPYKTERNNNFFSERRPYNEGGEHGNFDDRREGHSPRERNPTNNSDHFPGNRDDRRRPDNAPNNSDNRPRRPQFE